MKIDAEFGLDKVASRNATQRGLRPQRNSKSQIRNPKFEVLQNLREARRFRTLVERSVKREWPELPEEGMLGNMRWGWRGDSAAVPGVRTPGLMMAPRSRLGRAGVGPEPRAGIRWLFRRVRMLEKTVGVPKSANKPDRPIGFQASKRTP
jgi:hypothetical protein